MIIVGDPLFKATNVIKVVGPSSKFSKFIEDN